MPEVLNTVNLLSNANGLQRRTTQAFNGVNAHRLGVSGSQHLPTLLDLFVL